MKRLLIAALGFSLLSAGCVRPDHFRFVQNQPECFAGSTADPLPGAPGEKRAWPSLACLHTLYTVGYIEFNEQGKAIDPVQEAKALRLIEQAGKDCAGGKVITVVYVHGWKNNASEAMQGREPKDVEKFQTALLELGYRSRETARKAGARNPIPIVGVYMGWRGKTLMGPGWFTFLSYWGRRNNANGVGDGPDFASTLTRVIDAVNEGNTGSRVVLIGHSFGARVLEHAIEKRAVKLYKPAPGSNAMDPLVDLTLYVNSANDARLSMARVQALQQSPVQVRHPDYDPIACRQPDEARTARCREYPLLVAITSRGDLATKYLLPTANTLNLDNSAPTPPSPTGHYVDPVPPSGIYRRSAAGHLRFLQSHLVREVACPAAARPAPQQASAQTQDAFIREAVANAVAQALGKEDDLKAMAARKAQQQEQDRLAEEARLDALLRPVCGKDDEQCRFVFRTQSERPACFQVDQRSAMRIPEDASGELKPFNTTAFWIMDVDPVVIKDHGDIWNVSFVEMLGQLMAPRDFFTPGAGRVQLRSAPAAK